MILSMYVKESRLLGGYAESIQTESEMVMSATGGARSWLFYHQNMLEIGKYTETISLEGDINVFVNPGDGTGQRSAIGIY